ncbi:MAG: FecR domain-containing protein [Mariniphaga sp.]|nr:DUF4974 domain-containing protein [Mariniphaga sp.]MDD4424936.1 DUF4974 domain-containing protein [Mariniphaga sp.]
MIQPSDIEKLTRFRKGLSGEEEIRSIYSLFAEKEDSNELKYYLLNEWETFLKNNEGEHVDFSYLLDRIHHRIHLIETRKNQTLTRKIYRWYSLAAAILLVPLLIAGGLWFTSNSSLETVVETEKPVAAIIHAPLGSRLSFSLPDGTQGWLNSGSSLEYKLPFHNNRQVAIKGEAWFDVTHDDMNPFEITAGKTKVNVLGTQFNLNAYPEEGYVEVVLDEGRVEFTVPGISSPVQMQPNERLIYNNDSICIVKTEPSKYSSWIEGKLVFRGDPMPEVARRIARWYNVEVVLVDKDLRTDVMRGTFEDDSLEDVLRYMSMTSPIRYRIIDRKVLNDETFQKKKVMLYRKNM